MAIKNRALWHKKAEALAVPIVFLAASLVMPLYAFPPNDSSPAGLRVALKTPVPEFDNGGQPLIPTLIEIARTMKVPMGIEKVTAAALRKRVRISVRGGTIATILDACVRQLPDYHWALRDGAVDIYGEAEWRSKSNLFNYVIHSLDVKGGDLNLANAFLRMAVPEPASRLGASSVTETGGVAGSFPGVGGLRPPHVDLSFRDATVRSILNRIVALSRGQLIWVARVPPDRLNLSPRQGLWMLMPPSLDAIMPSFDRSLYARK